MATKKSETAIATISEYAILSSDEGGASLADIMSVNMGGADTTFTQFDLDRIGMPSGDMARFTVPTLDEPDYLASFEGVIIAQRQNRSYWSDPQPRKGSQPDCFSDDGITGHGNPGGSCLDCQFAKWGSDGSGQACKLTNPLFIVRPDDILPVMLNVPPSSLKPLQQYRLNLTKRRKEIDGVVTRFELEKATSQGGIDFYVIKLSYVEDVPAEHRSAFRSYGKTLEDMLRRSTPAPDNYIPLSRTPAAEDLEEEVAF
jgi:hypothetical protein